jgi:hypothetical protein
LNIGGCRGAISLPGEATTSVSGIVGRQPQGNLFRGRGRSQRELAGVVLPPGSPACRFEVAWAVPWLDDGPHRLADRPHGSVYTVNRARLIVFITCKSRYSFGRVEVETETASAR